MTAPHDECCPICAEGLLRFDPQTGETRCGNCWMRSDAPPVVLGGQGRSAAETRDDATGCAWVLAGFVIVAAAVLAVAVRS